MSINTKKYIESFLKIRAKNQKIIPFKINQPQMKLYNTIKELKQQGKPVRIIILKARQMGFSTLTEAILFKEAATHHNVNCGIIAHESRATNNLFTMSKLFYDYLPDEMKPERRACNAQEIIFNDKENTGLNSKITCMTAGDGAGRSGTYNILHLSEFAFWPGDKKVTLNGLMQAVPDNNKSIVIIESTANGFEYYKEMWDRAVSGESDFIPLFVAWYELDDYQKPYTGFKLTQEEITLKETFNLSNDQLEWRRWCIRNNCGGDVEQFKQEYPSTPEEAFLNTGKCVFDTAEINKRLLETPKPIKVGYFTYDYNDTLPSFGAINPYNDLPYPKHKISNIKWVNDPKGYIKIYEIPNTPAVVQYGIGGDTAGEGSDYFTAHVINSKTLTQCAVLRKQLDPDLYVKQVYCLGMYYNKALLGIESNFDTFPNKELQRLGYPKIYRREYEEKIGTPKKQELGFRTDLRTRPAIISYLTELVREHAELINDNDTLREMLVFIFNDEGRPEAQVGAHDDLVMGLAIAYRIINQISYTQNAIEIQNYFDRQNYYQDEGEREVVI